MLKSLKLRIHQSTSPEFFLGTKIMQSILLPEPGFIEP